jgi:hypothetical protein
MALPPTSDSTAEVSQLRFRNSEGDVISVPAEWTPAFIEVTAVPEDDWTEVRLWCQDQPLEIMLRRFKSESQKVCIVAEWPRSGPGHYRLRCRVPGVTQEHSQVVTVTPSKIDSNSFATLLNDLESRLPTSIAVSLQRFGAFAGMRFLPPSESTIQMEFLRLKRAVMGTKGQQSTEEHPGLVEVLHELALDPHQVLRPVALWVPAERARRPQAVHLVQALARGGNLDEQGSPVRILDTRVEHTFDVYENRLVKAFVEEVRWRLQRLTLRLQYESDESLRAQANELQKAMAQAVRAAGFLDEVTLPSYLPDRLTMVLLKRVPYRAALEGYLELHRSMSVHLKEPALESPLENLPHLYQVWGTLQVLDALLKVAVEQGYSLLQQRFLQRGTEGFFVKLLPDGQPILTLKHSNGSTVKLIPERAYGISGSARSISFLQKPDIAVEVQRPGSAPQLYLFDPKYKLDSEFLTVRSALKESGGSETISELLEDADDGSTEVEEETPPSGVSNGRPKKVDIDKMHTYRDAIRGDEESRVVEYATILYPGPYRRYTPGLEALRAYPGQNEILQERLQVVLRHALEESCSPVI